MSTKSDTDTGWKREWPTVNDYYFRRINERDIPSLVRIVGDTCRFSDGSSEGRYDCYEFLGPVTASAFEQLIRLRAAGQDAIETIQKLVNVLDLKTQRGMAIDADRVASALNEALVHTGEQS